MLSEHQVIEKILEKTGITVRPRTLERFAAAGLIGKPVMIGVSQDKTFWPDDTPRRFANAARKMAQSDQFKTTLVHRRFERDGDNIKMYSTYDHGDVFRRNYEQRMSGDRYIDQGKDFMRVASIPIAYLASLTPEQRHELETSPKALIKLLQDNPQFRTSTASL
jgi:hypothetical protein